MSNDFQKFPWVTNVTVNGSFTNVSLTKDIEFFFLIVGLISVNIDLNSEAVCKKHSGCKKFIKIFAIKFVEISKMRVSAASSDNWPTGT